MRTKSHGTKTRKVSLHGYRIPCSFLIVRMPEAKIVKNPSEMKEKLNFYDVKDQF